MTDEKPSHADPEVYIDLVGFKGDWRETWWNHDYLDLIARRFELGNVRRALDVGCGAGHWGRTVLPHLHLQAQLHGVDREPAFVHLAEQQADEKGITARTTYTVGKAEQLPFDDGTFDLVTCQTVLIHIADVGPVLREMTRVLRPGGLLLAAEPDNVATTASFHNTSVALSPEDMLGLVELQLWCEQGKRALGEGDSSVGAHLPGLLAAAGLQHIRAYNSDKCAMQLPPYDVPDRAIDLREQLRFASTDNWMQTGSRDDSRRLFVAGGGDPHRFDALWAVVLGWLREFEAQVEAREFTGSRGVAMYLVGGRKPSA